jgi:hypothetical protein
LMTTVSRIVAETNETLLSVRGFCSSHKYP